MTLAELQKLKKILIKSLFLKTIRDIHKIEKKKNSISISVFGDQIKKNTQSVYQKNILKKNILIYY